MREQEKREQGLKIGDRMIARRMKLRMEQMELARLVGVSAPTICRYEGGDRMPSPAILKKIAAALETTVDDLMRDL